MADLCPIDRCSIAATSLGLCRGHFAMVPRPIQSEIYQLVKRHKGGPAHRGAIARAMKAVRGVLDGWAKKKPGHPDSDLPGYLPYRDD